MNEIFKQALITKLYLDIQDGLDYCGFVAKYILSLFFKAILLQL